jgi:hypothetical protein
VSAKAGIAFSVLAIGLACAPASPARVIRPSYDAFSGRLIQLSADQDGDGRTDQWTYVDGTTPLRGEKDSDNDGRIDRWEYFGPQAELLTIGTSSRNDGIEDTWTWVSRVNGEGRVDLSVARDRHLDRHEYYVDTTLARVEQDTNADGRVDRWDRYESGVLREVQFDTSLKAARADRRLLYDSQGRFVGAEADDDRDGRFERVRRAF